jgi:hypothetical protein
MPSLPPIQLPRVVEMIDRGIEKVLWRWPPEPLLVLCQGDARCLLTNNVADFAVIARAWQTEGRTHAGLIFTSDVGWPRNRDTIGRYVDALAELMTANATVGSFADRIHWL